MCRSCDWDVFVDEANALLSRLDDLPEKAAEFADGVRDKVTGMRDWATQNEHVTERMLESLDRMEGGVSRWER